MDDEEDLVDSKFKKMDNQDDICKVVIYNHFVGFNFVPNLIVISFNHLYPVIIMGFTCKGCVIQKENVKTQAIEY